ncbi:hypothetical protein SGPA1_41075 [Streptomyces misionensis JCM 4497]
MITQCMGLGSSCQEKNFDNVEGKGVPDGPYQGKPLAEAIPDLISDVVAPSIHCCPTTPLASTRSLSSESHRMNRSGSTAWPTTWRRRCSRPLTSSESTEWTSAMPTRRRSSTVRPSAVTPKASMALSPI